MRGFGIWKIDDGIYDILDEGNSSFYIVEPPSSTPASRPVKKFCP